MGKVNEDIVYQIYLFLDVCSFRIMRGKFKKLVLSDVLSNFLIYYHQI